VELLTDHFWLKRRAYDTAEEDDDFILVDGEVEL